MRSWWLIPLVLTAGVGCHSNSTGPAGGSVPDVPQRLVGTSLDGAIALVWDDNAFAADPTGFQNYRVFSTSYSFGSDYLNGQCGNDWRLEGTTVAPEFLVGALQNGVAQCFAVTAMGVDQLESNRSTPVNDTPRPESHNVVVYASQIRLSESGFRFWKDANGDGVVQGSELGLVLAGNSLDADFSIERFRTNPDSLEFRPRRAGTLMGLYDTLAVASLQSIDLAPDPTVPRTPVLDYSTQTATAVPGIGYVFEMPGPGSSVLYGAVRPTHVGTRFVILEWSFQTDPDNPELRKGRKP